MSMLRNFATVGGATLASRLMGFARDAMLAAVVGTGPVADAFVVAFRLPNLFRRLFAEGAFNSAFVPLFGRTLEEEGEEAARRVAGEIAAACSGRLWR
ncbi:lipid II flippase MurJ [Pannonibacter sp. Pt2-lr]